MRYPALVFTIILIAAGCGKKSDNVTVDVTDAEVDMEIVDYEHGMSKLTPKQLDSLAVNAIDELQPGQAVGVLMYYSDIVNDSRGSKRWETMRKYRDVYDIVLGNYGSDFRAAVDKARSEKGVDLAQIYDAYAGRLTDYDDGSGIVSTDEAKPDSAKVAADSTMVVPADSLN